MVSKEEPEKKPQDENSTSNQDKGQEVQTVAILRQLIKQMFNEYASKNKLELNAIKDEAILLNKETRQAFEKF